MDIKSKVTGLGLNPKNSIVIGSGILNVLELRESNDIDVVVDKETYERLLLDTRFHKELNHGHEVITDGVFEIGESWATLGKDRTLADLMEDSVIIDEVRYLKPDFYLEVKKSWVLDGSPRLKDIGDIQLLEQYLKQ